MKYSKYRLWFYGLLSILGVILTMYFNIQFVIENNGFDLIKFIDNIYINTASTSISNDVFICAIAFLIFSFNESKCNSMKNWWIYIPLTFGVALAFSFPFFLFMRELKLKKDYEKKAI